MWVLIMCLVFFHRGKTRIIYSEHEGATYYPDIKKIICIITFALIQCFPLFKIMCFRQYYCSDIENKPNKKINKIKIIIIIIIIIILIIIIIIIYSVYMLMFPLWESGRGLYIYIYYIYNYIF